MVENERRVRQKLTGGVRRNAGTGLCKHSTLISKAHFGENPKPPKAEDGMAD